MNPPSFPPRGLPGLVLITLLLPLFSATTSAAEPNPGKQIYQKRCARCHGPDGAGTKKYPQALAGDQSVEQLTRTIEKTMPEDSPGSCTGDDAWAVATYIHESFYSAVARERLRPARVELARLTVAQYRNAVADLVGSFRAAAPPTDSRQGLAAEYYKRRRFAPGDRVLERLDPEVRFDFAKESPVPDKIEPHEFSIRWSGAVRPPVTGTYEFIVRTDHAARLWVNDPSRPLIDAWVKSGNATEYRGTIFLLAERDCSLKLEFSKAKQGVDDSNKSAKPPVQPAFVTLAWKPPHGPLEPIPGRFLTPRRVPEVYAPATPFPPDDRSYGWERGTTVSRAWDQATTDAALEAAAYVAARLPELAGAAEGAADRTAKCKTFVGRFVERAFRRPLDPPTRQAYVDRPFATTADPEAAVQRAVLLTLKSPRFLYREVGAAPDGFDVASRLSFALWDSLPDAPLLAAAAAGQLTTREQVTTHARRLLADPRARAKLRGFLHYWLKADDATELSKDRRRFPGFDPALAADLRTSLDLFLDEVVWSEASDFRQLLLGEDVYLNERLAKFYGENPPTGPGFKKVALDRGRRAGVLTHPLLMATFASNAESSPIHRGVFVARGILGVALRPPPEAVAPFAAELHPGLTTRERVLLQTKPAQCMTCHGVVNPLGFAFEGFDAAGRFRDKDNGKPTNTAGSYQTRDGRTVTFRGPRDMAEFLATTEEVHAAFVEQLFHHLVQQPVRAYGPGRLDELRKSFAAGGFHVRNLAVDIAAGAALVGRPATSAVSR